MSRCRYCGTNILWAQLSATGVARKKPVNLHDGEIHSKTCPQMRTALLYERMERRPPTPPPPLKIPRVAATTLSIFDQVEFLQQILQRLRYDLKWKYSVSRRHVQTLEFLLASMQADKEIRRKVLRVRHGVVSVVRPGVAASMQEAESPEKDDGGLSGVIPGLNPAAKAVC